jgi:two-component system sensor histidine kinase RegB
MWRTVFQIPETETRLSPTGMVFSWLLWLRWGAVACQIVLIVAMYLLFHIAIPLLYVSLIIGFEAGSNLFFAGLVRRRAVLPSWLFSLVMYLDVTLFTGLLYLTGGPMNPFSFLYLVHVVLGAILMRPRVLWGLTFFTIVCYGSLFLLPQVQGDFLPSFLSWSAVPLLCHESAGDTSPAAPVPGQMAMHLQGMWVAFGVTACFIVFFIGRIQRALALQQRTLEELRQQRVRNEKLASLATLAAGAAHEFATPLSTIAVAASEMVRYLTRHDGDSCLIDDARLIREQVAGCKEILFQMAADAGEHLGEAMEEFAVNDLLTEAVRLVTRETGATVEVRNQTEELAVMVPGRTFTRAIKGLLKNAFDASGPSGAITLSAWQDRTHLYIMVEDQGCGMTPEALARAAEPFFTGKEPGKGLGLGLYLAQTVAERFDGALTLQSEEGRGTRATLSFGKGKIGARMKVAG